MQLAIPVIAILADHLEVPSIVICSACSIESMCVSGSTENVVLHGETGNKNTDTTPHEHCRLAGYFILILWEVSGLMGQLLALLACLEISTL